MSVLISSIAPKMPARHRGAPVMIGGKDAPQAKAPEISSGRLSSLQAAYLPILWLVHRGDA